MKERRKALGDVSMRVELGRAALALLLIGTVTAAVAGPPNPFQTVPTDRAAQASAGTDRVFGGQPVADGQFPFQVALLKASDLTSDPKSQYSAQFCGGTLIASTWVLTAAHCMRSDGKSLGADDFFVLTGTTDLEAGKRIAVKSVAINDQYDDNSMDHDAALIELAEPVSLPPVALDTVGAPVAKATVLGWGMNEEGDYPRQLLETDLDVVAADACNISIKAIYAKALRAGIDDLAAQYRIKPEEGVRVADELAQNIADPLTGTMLCAGLKSGKRDACYGDSGGPLVADIGGKPVQLGIVSWGEGPADAEIKCGHQDVYGVYSRVASFADWIKSHLAGS